MWTRGLFSDKNALIALNYIVFPKRNPNFALSSEWTIKCLINTRFESDRCWKFAYNFKTVRHIEMKFHIIKAKMTINNLAEIKSASVIVKEGGGC